MEKTLVIKDELGSFVNLTGLSIVDNEWYYSRSIGLTEGIRFYTNPERAESICNNFQDISNKYNFGKTFSVESVNITDIPDGKSFCNKIYPVTRYFIKDSFNCIGGSLRLSVKNMDGSGLEWTYVASRNADSCHGNKNLAIAEIKRLKELNAIAGIEGISWELVCGNREDFPYIKREDNFMLPNLMILNKDIPKGCIGKHRKSKNEIKRKYKTIFSEIEKNFRGGYNGKNI